MFSSKAFFLGIFLGLFWHPGLASPAGGGLGEGMQAPAIELPTPSGESIRLSQYAGKVVYLDFWASWCGPCRQSFPWMNQMQEKYAKAGLVVLGVNLDSDSEDAVKFLARTPTRFQIALDPGGITPKTYGVKGMPSSFLISRDGKIVSRHTGFKGGQKDVLEQQIINALGNQP